MTAKLIYIAENVVNDNIVQFCYFKIKDDHKNGRLWSKWTKTKSERIGKAK